MTEPIGGHTRPTPMAPMVRSLRVVLVALAAALVLAGCGSAEKGSAAPSSSSDSSGSPESPAPTGLPSMPADEPPVTDSFSIDVPGHEGALLVTRQSHPRGGFQLRVFAPKEGAWSELETEGRPLVPFAATDVMEHPFSVDCGTGAVVVTEAVLPKAMGDTSVWDVVKTSYAVDGTKVTARPSEKIAKNVAAGELSAKWPALVKHAAFESCRTAG